MISELGIVIATSVFGLVINAFRKKELFIWSFSLHNIGMHVIVNIAVTLCLYHLYIILYICMYMNPCIVCNASQLLHFWLAVYNYSHWYFMLVNIQQTSLCPHPAYNLELAIELVLPKLLTAQ